MGTVAGVNTRRYHGILIATLHAPADRYSILPRVEETVQVGGMSFVLSTVQYPGTVTPTGYRFIDEFSIDPNPTWKYRCDELLIEKSLWLVNGEQTAVMEYRANQPCQLQVRWFISFREYHSLIKENTALNRQVKASGSSLTIRPYQDLPPLTLHHSEGRFEEDGIWFKNHEYLRELERGLDFREDLYSPGVLCYELTRDRSVKVVATLEAKSSVSNGRTSSQDRYLERALDQFRVRRADGKPTLIAGYPWFTDWSRDTLISIPAYVAFGFDLTEIKAVLEFLAAQRKQGILPNRFSDRGSTPEYNTVDASLLYFVAADAYIGASGDTGFLGSVLYPAAMDIIDWHRRGTLYGIKLDDSDQLLVAGEPGTQLTWMDAKIGDYVVTPRIGKPVEINALWYNALRIASKWASKLGEDRASYELLLAADATRNSFVKKFWNAARGCLYDVLEATGPDASLRPNQLFAASLPYAMLDREQAQQVVNVVERELLTPVGLRTLESSDPRYRPRFDGDMRARDSAYHQGTVWPWLIGPFVEAYLYAFNNSPEAKTRCLEIVTSVLRLGSHYCLGTIGEVFDGDAPHHPGGCPAQLWSVAQVALALQRSQS